MCTKLLCGNPKSVMSGMAYSVAQCPQVVIHRARDPHAKLGLGPPEGLIRLAEGILPRDADVLQQMKVVGLRDVAQRLALVRTSDPAGDRAAASRDPARDGTIVRIAGGFA